MSGMYDTMVKRVGRPAEFKALEDGSVSALFSVFNMIDDDGDVVMAGSIPDGQEVPIAYWGHGWDKPAVGKGSITTSDRGAVFDGKFFLNTIGGQDVYQTVKELGDLQDWSWGFRILEAEPGVFDGQSVRMIRRVEVYEVSPVLVGANREARTLAIKSQSYEAEIDAALAAAVALRDRTASVLALRQKEGRALSSARRERIGQHSTALRAVADDLDEMLEETAPKSARQDAARELARYIQITRRHNQ